MRKFIVHLYREMRLCFTDIEAETPEAAAEIVSRRPTGDADNVEDCEGRNLAALVDVAGDEDFSRSVTIDFEPERHRKAARKLLKAVRMAENYLADDLDEDDETEKRVFGAICDARAEAEAAGITTAPAAPALLASLRAVLPYAENECRSLAECWKRDGEPVAEAEATACEQAIAAAQDAIALTATDAVPAGSNAAPKLLAALKLAQQALNTAPRFRVGDTDSYKIASAVDRAIAEAQAVGITPAPADLDIHALLAERRQIAVIWSIEDVQEVRPDLSEDQCWEVLHYIGRRQDAEVGINWLTLEFAAEELFGDAPETDEAEGA